LMATTMGMLFTGIPVSALAQEPISIVPDKSISTQKTTSLLPDKLISAQELPNGVVVKEECIDNIIYTYDDNGKLVSTERVYEGKDTGYAGEMVQNKDNDTEDPVMNPREESSKKDELQETQLKDFSELGTILMGMLKYLPEETDNEGPLTPDGNMTLIDDYGDKPVAGKQFITLTTRSGAEFYLIIDRDDNGIETVHFLNKVDESDILAYLEDDEKAAYEERKTAFEEEKAALPTEEDADGGDDNSGSEDKKEAPDNDDGEKENDSSAIIVMIMVVAGIAAAIYIFVIKKKKRGPSNPAPTPDPDDFDDDLDDDPNEDEGEEETDEDV